MTDSGPLLGRECGRGRRAGVAARVLYPLSVLDRVTFGSGLGPRPGRTSGRVTFHPLRGQGPPEERGRQGRGQEGLRLPYGWSSDLHHRGCPGVSVVSGDPTTKEDSQTRCTSLFDPSLRPLCGPVCVDPPVRVPKGVDSLVSSGPPRLSLR